MSSGAGSSTMQPAVSDDQPLATGLLALPSHVLVRVLSFLDRPSVLIAAQACTELLACSGHRSLWPAAANGGGPVGNAARALLSAALHLPPQAFTLQMVGSFACFQLVIFDTACKDEPTSCYQSVLHVALSADPRRISLATAQLQITSDVAVQCLRRTRATPHRLRCHLITVHCRMTAAPAASRFP